MTNHPQHSYTGLGGLSVTTQGNDPQTEYQLREPRPQGEQRIQQCNPLSIAGRQDPEQNPSHPETRKKSRKYKTADDQKLQQAIDKDLSKRGVRNPKKQTTTDKTEQ